MKNVLLLGSGRSGTSMVAGCFSKSGYFMGDQLYPPRSSNPKGFYEDREINSINEDLLGNSIPKRPRFIGKILFRTRPDRHQRWLAHVPLDTDIVSSESLDERIQNATKKEPYFFKDPRFSYTLPAWRPYLKDAVFICVFRHPAVTATSILKECKQEKYLHSLSINFESALDVWYLMYAHILEKHRKKGDWLFIHFDQVLTEKGQDVLEKFTGAAPDRSFPEKKLRRTRSEKPVPGKMDELYNSLCELAGYEPSD